MKCFLNTFFFFFILFRGMAADPMIMLDSANNAYSKANYELAARQYEMILSLGYESPQVYFNLGNAYYKLDNLGLSILNYERAKKLSLHDEDINYNLKLANQRTLDKIEPMPKLFLEEWWENLKNMHSERTWAIRSIVCFILFFFFIGVFIVSNKLLNKQFGFWLSILFFVFSTISFFISKSRYNDITHKTSAVILSASAEIKNAPAESGIKLFILHEGTKVSSKETQGEWVKVSLTPEKVGWVKRSAIEFI